MRDLFKNYAANEKNPNWDNIISREYPLYKRNNDIRSDFERDYTRILHSQAFRRMKHKTQVFFSPSNDHICTRIEHVMYVESISYTIAKALGLNTELTKAISIGHDLGHSPFGHQGERILSELMKKDIGQIFWHEKNGLNMVDNIELLDTPEGFKQNLDLTYAVRDGIISHCGEIDENFLKPRKEFIDLNNYNFPNQYSPYTWEGCVVKIADKISYLGRDIQDAITLGILDEKIEELHEILEINKEEKIINNTNLINDFISDLCENSNPEEGLKFSDKMFDKINKIKKFDYEKIYLSEKELKSVDYYRLILSEIYYELKKFYENEELAYNICPDLITDFKDWLKNYTKDISRNDFNRNKILFDLNSREDQIKTIIYYISGMTDNYAIEMYNKILKF